MGLFIYHLPDNILFLKHGENAFFSGCWQYFPIYGVIRDIQNLLSKNI